MVNFGPLAAEIGSLVCGTPANFSGFRVLGHVFLLSRWPAAGRLSVSVLCFCPAADLIYGSRWAAYSAPFVAD